jgi:hypothetical protein
LTRVASQQAAREVTMLDQAAWLSPSEPRRALPKSPIL